MTTRVESLRREIRELSEKRVRGDIPQKAFERQNEKLTVDLCRHLVRERIPADEAVLVEHHVIRAHTKLAGSVLRESEQESISLLATARRLFRLRCRHKPEEPALFRTGSRDEVEEVAYERMGRIVVRRQIRTGEVMVGIAIIAGALLFRSWLQVTGIALVMIGIAGALHGMLIPTRWAEVPVTGSGEDPLRIYALRKRSAKKLIKVLSSRIGATG